eukprot:3598662-Pleurochrysis_carterae.AAC.3
MTNATYNLNLRHNCIFSQQIADRIQVLARVLSFRGRSLKRARPRGAGGGGHVHGKAARTIAARTHVRLVPALSVCLEIGVIGQYVFSS